MTEPLEEAEHSPYHSNAGKKQPLFSIIVPAYNVEEYLDECIESVLDNLLDDYEIVLVDDGSSDTTPRLVDKWAKHDSRIKAIHQNNGGLSAARNVGITTAQGRYVVFLDADDCLAPWALNDLVDVIREASEPDIIITELSNVSDVSRLPSREEVASLNALLLCKDEAFEYVFTKKPHTWPAPQYPMKRSFIEKAGLAFVHGILHEDICWTAEAMAPAKSFAAYGHPWYIRRYGRDGSIMSSVSVRHITDTVGAVRIALDSPHFSGLTERRADLLRKRLAMSLFPSLRLYGRLGGAEKAKVAACVEENLGLFALSRKPAHRIFVIACKVMGVKRALQLISAR